MAEKSVELQSAITRVGTPQDWKYVESMSEVQARAMTSMWVLGADYVDIADKWECSIAAARLAVERTLADSLDDTEDRSKQRRRLVMQYDALLREYMPLALKKGRDQQGFGRLVMQIALQKSKLLGLDAPMEVNVNMPTSQEMLDWAGQVLALKGMGLPEEGDPFLELEENPETGVYE
jgi:hypothetical protein